MTAETDEELLRYLKDNIGYCSCAADNALPMLRDFLQHLQDKSKASERGAMKKAAYKDTKDDDAAFEQSDAAIKKFLETSPGLTDWFIFGLEGVGLVSHGFRIDDVWITEKGQDVLKRLQQNRS